MWEILCLRHYCKEEGEKVPIMGYFKKVQAAYSCSNSDSRFYSGTLTPLTHMPSHLSPAYVHINIYISDLLQIPIGNSNNCY